MSETSRTSRSSTGSLHAPLSCRREVTLVVTALAVLSPFAALAVHAAGLAVNGAAAFSGRYGLAVTAGSNCTYANIYLDIRGPKTVSGPRQACAAITAGGGSGTVDVFPSSTFTAGEGIVLRDGFQVGAGGEFTAVIQGGASPFAYVVSDHPSSESTYRAEFYLHPNSIDLGSGDRLEHFNGYSSSGAVQFKVILKKVGSEHRLYVEAYQNGSLIDTTEGSDERLLIGNGWNQIEIDWQSGSGNGHLWLRVEGQGSLSGLDDLNNSASRIDSVRWGAVGGSGALTSGPLSGPLYLDDFSSWR